MKRSFLLGVCSFFAAAALAAEPQAASPSPGASVPAGARRFDVPGGHFMLPAWDVRNQVVDKAAGIISLARPGGAGSLCVTWAYQQEALTPKELAEAIPSYLELTERYVHENWDPKARVVKRSEPELDTVDSHPAYKVKLRIEGPETLEGALAIWDCPNTHRTFAYFCHAPKANITSQLTMAIGKHARCHETPLTYEAEGPLAVVAPAGWQVAQKAPNQQILASPDQKVGVYLFGLANNGPEKLVPQNIVTILETVSRLVGKLVQFEQPTVAADAKLGHEVGSVKAKLLVDKREASGLFQFWYCPHKKRLYARIVLASEAKDLALSDPVLASVHCH